LHAVDTTATSVPVRFPVRAPTVIVHTHESAGDWTGREIAFVADQHPGTYRLALATASGHVLTYGPDYSVEPCRELVAALEPFGRVEVVERRA
jgi:hypothetical protein